MGGVGVRMTLAGVDEGTSASLQPESWRYGSCSRSRTWSFTPDTTGAMSVPFTTSRPSPNCSSRLATSMAGAHQAHLAVGGRNMDLYIEKK